MAYCHECGEEIAEIDTFCPFCGISLQPILASPDEDQSQEDSAVAESSELSDLEDEKLGETIAINSKEFPEIQAGEKPVEKDTEVSLKTEETIEPIDESVIELKDKQEASDTGENPVHDDSTDPKHPIQPQEYIPEEKLLFTARSLNTATPKKDKVDEAEVKVDKKVDEVKEKSEQSEIDSSKVESSLDEIDSEPTDVDPVKPQTESSMMSYEESEIKEKTTVEENVFGLEDSFSNEDMDFDFNATIPYIPNKLDKIEEKPEKQEVDSEPLEEKISELKDKESQKLSDYFGNAGNPRFH